MRVTADQYFFYLAPFLHLSYYVRSVCAVYFDILLDIISIDSHLLLV